MNKIDIQRENLGLTAIFMIINSSPIGNKIAPKIIQKVRKVLKEFDRVESGKYKKRISISKPLQGHRWVKKYICARFPCCNDRCLKK